MIRIVLVDDHQLFLDGISSVLKQQKEIEVVAIVNSPLEALSILKKDTPNLLITDISMPDMNGFEFIKIVKKEYPLLKILIISMFRQLHKIDGIDGYLLKESDSQQVLKTIKEIVIENKKRFYNDDYKVSIALDFNKKILTPREKEIVKLIAKGFTVDTIAEKLFLSRYTIETHKKNIFLKLQIKNIAELVRKAMYLGFLD